MTPQLIEAIGAGIALITVGTFTLVGMRMWLRYRIERPRGGAGAAEIEALADAVEKLGDEVGAMRQDLAELHERVDFAERLIARAQDAPPRLP